MTTEPCGNCFHPWHEHAHDYKDGELVNNRCSHIGCGCTQFVDFVVMESDEEP